MKLKLTHMNQTQIGKLFGVSFLQIGIWLTEIGLREADGTPTCRAQEGGFCKPRSTCGETGPHWMWDSQKTVASLVEAGHLLLLNPPSSLISSAALHGPFHVRNSSSAQVAIENGDGSTCIWVNNKSSADVLAQILNLAHENGDIDRLCMPQQTAFAISEKNDSCLNAASPVPSGQGDFSAAEHTFSPGLVAATNGQPVQMKAISLT